MAGNSGTVDNPNGFVLTFKPNGIDEEDFTGAELVFVTKLINGTRLEKLSADGGIIIDGGKVTIPFTLADSRLLPAGGSVPYSLEWRKGAEQRERASGKIKVSRGANIG